MVLRSLLSGLLAGCATALLAQAPPPKPTNAKICLNCHQPAPRTLRGNFDNLALKNASFQLKIDEHTEVLRFDKAKVKVVAKDAAPTVDETLKAIAKGHEVAVQFEETEGIKTATLISVKPPVSLDPKETITLAEVEKLVALGPDKGNYFLADCRPAPRFMEGNIPTAVNVPFPSFDKLVDRLPADKGKLIIYYCSGKTCNMSPGSLRKAQKLGYTNVKVFVDGMPGWYAKHPGLIAPKAFQEVFPGKDQPAIVLDLRPAAEVAKGHVKGAVAVAAAELGKVLAEQFPAPKVKPPVLVVDAEGGPAAQAAAEQIVKAGYRGVNVLQGGMKAWLAEGMAVATGSPAAKVAFVPKPRPGSISAAEFTKLAEAMPEKRGVVVLDVRNPDETKNGSIKGALLIPEPQLAARLAELPKGKPVLVHCSTGIRAELAYHLLKEKGYDARFLNNEITVIDTGEFLIE